MPIDLDVHFEPAGGEGARLGESPFWDHGDSIWWVDIPGRKLLQTRLATRTTRSWTTPEVPGFVVLTGVDQPVVGMERGIYAFSQSKGSFDRLVAFDGKDQRFNDATVDDTGRLWASTMALDATPGCGALHVVMEDLSLRTVLNGLTLPNGLATDTLGGALFVSDSHPEVQTIWSADCDFSTGEIGDRTEFASMRRLAGRPDGAALAASGSHYWIAGVDGAALAASGSHYWIAGVDGAALYGFSRGGLVEFTVPLPFPAPTKLAFFAGGVAVTAKGEGGYGGQLAIATDVPPALRGPAVAFWRPGGSKNAGQ